MRNKEKALLLLSVGVAILLPTLALAAGLVPCNGIDCNLCNVGELIQGIINFLIEITIPLFAVLFAWAGFLIFTSAGDTHKISRAKEIFSDALIGFAIALSGWLVVQTILSVIIDKSFWIGGNWNQLECVSALGTSPGQRLEGTSISDVLNNVLGTPQHLSGPAPDSAGLSQGTSNPNATNSACSSYDLTPLQSCVAVHESRCNPSIGSGTDLISDATGRTLVPVSWGLGQYNISANIIRCGAVNDGQPIPCPNAFGGGAYTSKNHDTYITDQTLYEQCKQAANNPQCAVELMAQQLNPLYGGLKNYGTRAQQFCAGL